MTPKPKIRHIPDGSGRTYCGRDASRVACISILRDCIEDAECRACQRSDDRRSAEDYRREIREQNRAERSAVRGAPRSAP